MMIIVLMFVCGAHSILAGENETSPVQYIYSVENKSNHLLRMKGLVCKESVVLR